MPFMPSSGYTRRRLAKVYARYAFVPAASTGKPGLMAFDHVLDVGRGAGAHRPAVVEPGPAERGGVPSGVDGRAGTLRLADHDPPARQPLRRRQAPARIGAGRLHDVHDVVRLGSPVEVGGQAGSAEAGVVARHDRVALPHPVGQVRAVAAREGRADPRGRTGVPEPGRAVRPGHDGPAPPRSPALGQEQRPRAQRTPAARVAGHVGELEGPGRGAGDPESVTQRRRLDHGSGRALPRESGVRDQEPAEACGQSGGPNGCHQPVAHLLREV